MLSSATKRTQCARAVQGLYAAADACRALCPASSQLSEITDALADIVDSVGDIVGRKLMAALSAPVGPLHLRIDIVDGDTTESILDTTQLPQDWGDDDADISSDQRPDYDINL